MLSAIVTKKSVNYVQPKLHNIVFNLVLKDGDLEVLNKDFSCQYHQGQSIAQKVTEVKEAMQIVIEQYKAKQVIFNSAGLANAVTAIQEGLIL